MESRPPQEPPRRSPTNGRKPSSPSSAPAPPWVWFLIIGVVALSIYLYSPSKNTPVSYSWFRDQVAAGNVKALSIQGLEATGQLREKADYNQIAAGAVSRKVEYFSSAFPSEYQIQPVLDELDNYEKREPKRPRVLIEAVAPQAAGAFLWLTLLLPTLLFVGLIYIMMRRARDQFDGGETMLRLADHRKFGPQLFQFLF